MIGVCLRYMTFVTWDFSSNTPQSCGGLNVCHSVTLLSKLYVAFAMFSAEQACSIHGNGEYWDKKEMRVRGAVEVEPDTAIKLIRKGCIR